MQSSSPDFMRAFKGVIHRLAKYGRIEEFQIALQGQDVNDLDEKGTTIGPTGL